MSALSHAIPEICAGIGRRSAWVGLAAALVSGIVTAQAAEGDPARGSRQFGSCAACHSLIPGEHLTGPSLHGVFGRKAGTATGFARYSPALKSGNVTWNAETLDAWLRDPDRFIPDNWMQFPGIQDARGRADLVAYLQAVGEGQPGLPVPRAMRRANLKKAPPDAIVKSIEYCGDAYRVKTGDGREHVIWEFNLRFKTDSTANGPSKGQPVLVGAGMQADRAFVVFQDPVEIGTFIRRSC